MYIIQTLSRQEIISVYERYLVQHFPADEVKPLKNIMQMYEQGQYIVYGLYGSQEESESKELCGYAYCAMNEKMCLLDYFAILDEFRDRGIGGYFLKELTYVLSEKDGILIETEDIDYAYNEQQKQTRLRRDAFYTKNGGKKIPIKGCVYGVHYQLWYLSEKEQVDISACYDNLVDIYHNLIQGEKFIENVKIVRID